MKKTDKKIENAIRASLTEVCEIALKDIAGFQWITHFVNYSDFPKSLSIVCVFDTDEALSNVLNSRQEEYLHQLIKATLSAANIPIKDIRKQVSFDTEEACQNENNGKWQARFRFR